MKKLFIFALLQLFSVSSFAAIQLEATRVIYNSNSSSASLSLNNGSDQNYMLQSWLENENPRNNAAIPMQVIPPIMRIDAGKEATLRFIYPVTDCQRIVNHCSGLICRKFRRRLKTQIPYRLRYTAG